MHEFFASFLAKMMRWFHHFAQGERDRAPGQQTQHHSSFEVYLENKQIYKRGELNKLSDPTSNVYVLVYVSPTKEIDE